MALTRGALTRGALAVVVAASAAAWAAAWAAPAARASDLQDGDAAFDAARYQDAFRFWSAADRAGDAQAAFDLGLLYDLGEGVAPNAATAFQCYRRAAEAGLGAAAFNVGVMYDSGRGAPEDRNAAALWYARAAVLGQARAAFNLGQLYEAGEGVPQNIDAAILWYSRAAADIPEAASRAQRLAAQRPAMVPGPLIPPAPAWPAQGTVVRSAGAVQLVWSAPAEPEPVTYFVELEARENGSFREVTAGYFKSTAVAVTLPDDEAFAWRVYAVATNGSAYAISAWTQFVTVNLAQVAAFKPPPGSQPRVERP
jgi:tetratricopeptide (TPR) repeat protein